MQDDRFGPALRSVRPTDPQALAALFAELRARVATVRRERIWQWFGGVPYGFGSPHAPLHGIWLQLAFVALVGVALVVAGFTSGPWLWTILGLAVGCLLLRSLLLGRPVRATLRFYQRAELAPAFIVAHDPRLEQDDDDEGRCAAVLLAAGAPDPARVPALLAAGERLRRLVAGVEPADGTFAAFVSEVRTGVARTPDGARSRVNRGSVRADTA